MRHRPHGSELDRDIDKRGPEDPSPIVDESKGREECDGRCGLVGCVRPSGHCDCIPDGHGVHAPKCRLFRRRG